MQDRFWLFLSLLFFASRFQAQPAPDLVDDRADKRVRALFLNLQQISKKGILFGHQDALAYGVHWKEEPGRSDVKDVCGAYPAVYGWDVSKLGKYAFNIDTVDFERMKGWMVEAYKMGGVNTISWHMDNPVSGGSSWDRTRAMHTLLPGGENHEWYKNRLDLFAEYISDIKTGFLFFKHRVPVIFRPFHEMSGSWFWWGGENVSPEDYKAVWRFTVHYLRDEKKLHNLLYAYSPDIVDSEEAYLKFYPGDDYVDILGLDDYHDVSSEERAVSLTRRLRMLVQLAEDKGKVAAMTETGFESIPRDDWWTEVLLKYITADPVASRIAWVLVWRNARLNHHYAPFPGHRSAANFVKFCEDPVMLLSNDLPKMYRMPRER